MKTYIKPQIEIVELATECIMAASGPLGDTPVNNMPTNDGDGNMFAKGHTSVWDFDEDDE